MGMGMGMVPDMVTLFDEEYLICNEHKFQFQIQQISAI